MNENNNQELSFSSIKNKFLKSESASDPGEVNSAQDLKEQSGPSSKKNETISPESWGPKKDLPGFGVRNAQKDAGDGLSPFERTVQIIWNQKHWVIISLMLGSLTVFLLNLAANKQYISRSVLAIDIHHLDNNLDSILYFGNLSDQLLFSEERFEKVRRNNTALLGLVSELLDTNLSSEELIKMYRIFKEPESDRILIEVKSHSGDFSQKLAGKLAGLYEEYDFYFRRESFLIYRKVIRDHLYKIETVLKQLNSNKILDFDEEPAVTGNFKLLAPYDRQLRDLELKIREKKLELQFYIASLKKIKSRYIEKKVTREMILKFMNLNDEVEQDAMDKSGIEKSVSSTWDAVQTLIEINSTNKKPVYSLSRLRKLKSRFSMIKSDLKSLTSKRNRIHGKLDSLFALRKEFTDSQAKYWRHLREKNILNNFLIQLHIWNDYSDIAFTNMKKAFRKIGKGSDIQIMREQLIKPVYVYLIFLVLLGVAVCFLLEALNSPVNTPSDLENNLGLPVLGLINRLESPYEPVVSDNENFEIFRNLKINLEFSSMVNESDIRRIMVMSSIQGEGRTTVSLQLAYNYINDGRKVLLIDGSSSSYQLHSVLNLETTGGISEYIKGGINVADAVSSTNIPGLFVLTSGNIEKNQISGSYLNKLQELAGDKSLSYDIIIIDAPPLGKQNGDFVISESINDVLCIFRSNYSTFRKGRRFVEVINQGGQNYSGAVLNGINNRGIGGFWRIFKRGKIIKELETPHV